jgi:hypothetical protein
MAHRKSGLATADHQRLDAFDLHGAGSPKFTATASGLIPTFASHRSGYFCECWNQKTTSKLLILVELWI